jgi:hypothetical protein
MLFIPHLRFEVNKIVEQTRIENYSFVMLSSIMLPTPNLASKWEKQLSRVVVRIIYFSQDFRSWCQLRNICFDVNKIVEQNVPQSYSLTTCSPIVLLSLILCFWLKKIIEQSVPENYSSIIWPSIMVLASNLTF